MTMTEARRIRNGTAPKALRRTIPCGVCGYPMKARYGSDAEVRQPEFCSTCRSVYPDLVKKWGRGR